jgi:hypothetical protein
MPTCGSLVLAVCAPVIAAALKGRLCQAEYFQCEVVPVDGFHGSEMYACCTFRDLKIENGDALEHESRDIGSRQRRVSVNVRLRAFTMPSMSSFLCGIPVIVPSSSTPTKSSPPSAFANATSATDDQNSAIVEQGRCVSRSPPEPAARRGHRRQLGRSQAGTTRREKSDREPGPASPCIRWSVRGGLSLLLGPFVRCSAKGR